MTHIYVDKRRIKHRRVWRFASAPICQPLLQYFIFHPFQPHVSTWWEKNWCWRCLCPCSPPDGKGTLLIPWLYLAMMYRDVYHLSDQFMIVSLTSRIYAYVRFPRPVHPKYPAPPPPPPFPPCPCNYACAPPLGRYINRLSDLLFAAARYASVVDGKPERPWKKIPVNKVKDDEDEGAPQNPPETGP